MAFFQVMPKQPGFEDRVQLYKLYHYLNHYNLFGSSYRGSAMSIIQRFIWNKCTSWMVDGTLTLFILRWKVVMGENQCLVGFCVYVTWATYTVPNILHEAQGYQSGWTHDLINHAEHISMLFSVDWYLCVKCGQYRMFFSQGPSGINILCTAHAMCAVNPQLFEFFSTIVKHHNFFIHQKFCHGVTFPFYS